jgi:hypothetical protein
VDSERVVTMRIIVGVAAFVLVACETNMSPTYPDVKCTDVHDAKMDPASYVVDDWRAMLFADDRDTWQSNRCDAVRSALTSLASSDDIEDETVARDCDGASSRVDAALRSACRAGCYAERRYRAHVEGWSRALKGVAAFAPGKLDVERVAKTCAPLHTDPPPAEKARPLWACAHLPLPPKRFHLDWRNRVERIPFRDKSGQDAHLTRDIGFDWMSATVAEGRRDRAVTLEECGGSSSHWGVFER